jgi:hypothetical protein
MSKENRDLATRRTLGQDATPPAIDPSDAARTSCSAGAGPTGVQIERPKVGAIRETYVNATKGHCFGERVCRDPPSPDPGELFRACRSEYGRCASRIYVDADEGPKACGWVFQRRERHEDSEGTYLREVWVDLLAEPDTVVRHRLYLDGEP